MVIILLVLFLIMFLFPVVVSWTYYKTKKSDILFINQGYVKDPRYFGLSFAKMVEGKLPQAKNKKIQLSREEQFYDAKDIRKKEGSVDKLVLCKDKLILNPKITGFAKEIYCGEDSIFDIPNLDIRAIYGKDRIILGDKTNIERWVDAENGLVIYDNCNLGVSASSGQVMCVGYDCKFQRLFAPRIYIGQRPDSIAQSGLSKNASIYLMSANSERKQNIRYISKDRIDENGVCDFSIISRRNVTLNEGIILKGNIRSHKGVRICKNSVVVGNVFSENNILIEEGAIVLGNILSQSSIKLEKGAIVGMDGQISSIIARDNVVFDGDNVVYGYVSCERGGKVNPSGEHENDAKNYVFIESEDAQKSIKFESVEEYNAVARKGYRKNNNISSIIIPEGAESITQSLCFACESLVSVEMPTSIKRICPYAFADCRSLEAISDLSNTFIEEICTSAFENDEKIKAIHLPNTLKILGPASFAGCKGLESVLFDSNSQLTKVADHCFRDCECLDEIILPDTVEVVGISAFSGCKNLKKISIPQSIESQPGITQLRESIQKINIELR